MRDLISKLWFQVLVGMILGVFLGLLLSPSVFALVDEKLAFSLAPWIGLIGNIFLGKPMSGKLHLPTSFARNFLIFLLVYSILRNIPLSPFIYLAPES